MSAWDDPRAAAAMAGGEFVKWENVGDKVVGTWLSIDFEGGEDFNGKVCPLAVIETDDGETRKITVAQANLKAKLYEARPESGDRVGIAYVRDEKVDKGTMKVFDVEVKRAATVAAEKPSSLL